MHANFSGLHSFLTPGNFLLHMNNNEYIPYESLKTLHSYVMLAKYIVKDI